MDNQWQTMIGRQFAAAIQMTRLALMLRRHSDIGVDWLGTQDNKPTPPTWK